MVYGFKARDDLSRPKQQADGAESIVGGCQALKVIEDAS
jgi:hypothetical protein